jgi:hypothetical protein
MSFEQSNPSEGGDTRLDAREAHEEANMLRLTIEKATPEDYDRALKELEELTRLAEEGAQGVDKVKQYITRSIVATALPYELIMSVIQKASTANSAKKYRAAMKAEIDSAVKFFTEDMVKTEAQTALALLKGRAEAAASEEKLQTLSAEK